jgi:hypothetical protein
LQLVGPAVEHVSACGHMFAIALFWATTSGAKIPAPHPGNAKVG